MNNKKLAVMLLFTLIIIPSAYAFELNSNELTKNTCQGNTILFTANIFGTGNFNVNLDGSASSWSTAVPQGFILNNNGKTAYIYSTPNNNVAPGRYSLNLIVSNQQETKTIPFTINVENCHNLQLNGDVLKEICGGQIASYSYQIKNLGNYKEDYQLSLRSQGHITLSQNIISLNPGETKKFYAYADKNSESSRFTISAFNRYGIAEISSELKANSCYDFSTSSDKDFVNFCEHSGENIALEIKNMGIQQDKYALEIEDGPAWANLDKKELILGPGKSGNVNVILSPDYGVSGNYDIKLRITSNAESKTRLLKAQVNKCNDVYIDIKEKDISVCRNSKIPVYIKNTGTLEKEFRLDTSEQWTSLDINQLKLKPGEERNLNLILDVGDLEKKTYDVYTRILALDGSGLSMEDKIKIKVLNDIQCHNTEIVSENSIAVTQSSSSTLPIMIKNNGNDILTYEVSIAGDGSSFTQLNPSIVELSPGAGETVYLYSAPSIEVNPGNYNIDIRISYNSNILASKAISINVRESSSEKKEYIPFTLRILNFLRNLFPENKSNQTEIVNNGPEEEIEETGENAAENSNKTSFVSGTYEKIKPYWIYILIGTAIIIALIFIFSSKTEDEEEEEFEEAEDEDDEKPLKIGRWILGTIIIAGIAYAQIKYNLFNYAIKYFNYTLTYAEIYKFYILVGLILLLIIVLIAKYWSSIIDFFEEEETPKKSRRNKK